MITTAMNSQDLPCPLRAIVLVWNGRSSLTMTTSGMLLLPNAPLVSQLQLPGRPACRGARKRVAAQRPGCRGLLRAEEVTPGRLLGAGARGRNRASNRLRFAGWAERPRSLAGIRVLRSLRAPRKGKR